MHSTYASSSPTAPRNTSLPPFRSNPPSPVAPFQPSLPFAFPRPHTSSIAPYLSSNEVEVSPITPASSTLRFHEALAGIPSRHRPTSSSSSAASSASSSSAFRFPPDSASPTGDTVFGTLQKELGGGSGIVGLGLAEGVFGSRGPSPSFGRHGGATQDGRLFEEPEQLEEYTGAYGESPRRRGEPSGGDEFGLDEELDDFEGATNAGMGGGIGRPASMDMGGDSETSFDFLLSPPPSFDPSTSTTRQFAAAASDTPRPKERSRTFPAPLLLKGDRSFGGSGAPVPSASIPPLRKATVGSVPSGNNLPSTQPPPRQWAPHISTVFPPPPVDLDRANASFQRHRCQHSPNSSLTQLSTSQSSTTYSHTSSASASSSSVPTASSSISSLSTAPTSVSNSTSSSIVEPPIAPQALLLYILSLRSALHPMSLSQSQGPASRSGIPLFSAPSHQRIRSAGSASSDNEDSNTPPRSSSTGRLDTVDLSHKRIAEVPIEVVEELRDEVEKLALGYNLLRGLPPQFSALGSKLKYLNVRVNMLTVFPQVLCEMPSLEILDISRNKIKFLPTVPGTLMNLKVFSIAKNRIKRLPTYLAQMAHLKVLKIDHNPLEWPPKEITVFPTAGSGGGSALVDVDARRTGGSRVEDAEEMARWLPSLVRWIRENGDADRRVERPPHSAEQTSDEDRPSAQDHDRTPRAENGRLFSATANPAFAGTRPLRIATSSQPGLRSPLEPPSLDPPSPLDDDQSLRIHGRNASHSTMQSLEPEKRPGLKSKKSLPDLRLSHADILAERRTGTGAEDEGRATMPSVASALRRLKEDRRPGVVHANSARAALPTQLAHASSAPASSAPSTPSAAPRSQSARAVPTTLTRSTGVRPTPPYSSATRAGFEPQSKMKRGAVDTNANGLDRNSGAYFRRLSMLPTSTISKAVPVTLLEFADAIRGILFSLSQIYTALRQFVVFASQDRLPAPLARLMGTADGSMSLLINALDRFDSLSRRGTPNPTIVRDIFVTCRDNVVTFSKLVTALGPQLKALVATADVRYTRTLLLMLYGSMGEIAKSWNAVSPLLEEMTVLNEDPSLATLILQPPTPSPTSLSSSTSSRPGPAGVGSLYRARSKSRRHAGSFSVEDVQLGAVIPPAPFPPPTPTLPSYPPDLSTGPLSAGSASASSLPNDPWAEGTIKVRPGKSSRTPVPPSIPMPSQPGYRDLVLNAFDHPMTPSGTALMLSDTPDDLMSASTYASFNLGSTLPLPPNSAPSRTETFAVPRSEGLRNGSTANADELFLNLVEATTSIAFDVYGMLLNSFDEDADGDDDEGAGVLMRDLGPRRTKELTDMCILGNETTTKLRGALGRVRGPEGMHGSLSFSPADAKRLGDESYAFVQTVIRFAKLVKATSVEHGFAPRIREGVGQLTIATREFAKHLSHTATSFRPAAPSVFSGGGAVLRS